MARRQIEEARSAERRRDRPAAAGASASPPLLPSARRAESLDDAQLEQRLRVEAARIALAWLDFTALAREALARDLPARAGYLDPGRYFEERIGVSYRTVRRWLSVFEAVERLPEPERPAARAALAGVGAHKAAVLAPILGPATWRGWVQRAEALNEPQLQDVVSQATGAKPRGVAAEPGAGFLRFILSRMPDDETREEVESVFRLGARLADSPNPVAVFLAMVKEVKVEWTHRATP